MLGAAAALLVSSTGCLHHHTRGGLANCEPASCETTEGCETLWKECKQCRATRKNVGGWLQFRRSSGCVPGKLGWQRGGHDYSSKLRPHHGHAHPGHSHAGHAHPGHAGMQSAVMAYPYYTIRSPRDFLMDNPPSIGY